ncbi:MAG: peptidylprolyl isomerase, partial [Burkholderiaceae bacterium]
ITAASTGCKGMALSTMAPNVSGSITAYFTCTVSAVGSSRVDVTASSGGAALGSAAFDVLQPQVKMTLSNGNGGAVNGDIVITLDPAKVPITVDNFLAYVNAGFYTGTIFHRVVPGFVVQGGGYLPLNGGRTPTAKPTNPPIVLEVGAGLSNVQWTVAMARTAQPNTATSQFFVNVVNNSASLDPGSTTAGYAVFGSVTTGTGVVTALTGAPCTPITGFSECAPNPDAIITAASQIR